MIKWIKSKLGYVYCYNLAFNLTTHAGEIGSGDRWLRVYRPLNTIDRLNAIEDIIKKKEGYKNVIIINVLELKMEKVKDED